MPEPRRLRVTTLSQQGREDDLRGTTAEERFNMMWQLAVDAWAFKGEAVVDERLPRHVVRVIRGGEVQRLEDAENGQ
jgi:hypothetical protein